MSAKAGPMDIYGRLPKTNCGECGQKTCMAFAILLLERKARLASCPLLEEGKRRELSDLLAPSIRFLQFGMGENAISIGGQDVFHRHELTYFGECAFASEISDLMADEEVAQRVGFIDGFTHERIGERLTLQAIAIRNASGDEDKFCRCVERVASLSEKALILLSKNPVSLEEGLKICGTRKPLVYAATADNWREVGSLALKYSCPLAVSAQDADELPSLLDALRSMGVTEMALDLCAPSLARTLDNLVMVRMAGTRGGDTAVNYPLVGVPSAVESAHCGLENPIAEVMVGASMIVRFCDLLILGNVGLWSLLPLLTLRQNVYSDPRMPKAVRAGLNAVGEADRDSPLLCTTNFALTYHTVMSDIRAGKVDCHLLVFDTDGLGVDSSIAGGQLDAFKAHDAMEKSGVAEKVDHRRIIIPGLASRISGDLERLSGWEVVVGPRDSSGIPAFLEKLDKERKE